MRWWHNISAGGFARTIDRRIAAQVVDSVVDLLHRLRQRDSEVRAQFRAAAAKLTDDLTTSPEQNEKIQRLKNLLFDDPEVKSSIGSAWNGFSNR